MALSCDYNSPAIFCLEPLEFFVNPVDKTKVVGDNMTLCCQATGVPLPSYYEWFKNDDVVDTVFTSNRSELELTDVTLADSGSYSCRASNDYSASVSAVALIQVRGAH